MSYPRFQRSRDFKYKAGTGSNYAITGTSWSNLDTATDIVLVAEAGDVIQADGTWYYQGEAEYACIDVATIVSAAVVNTFSTQGAASATSQGIPAWFGLSAVASLAGGSWCYTVVSGDLSAGTLTLRLRKRAMFGSTKNIPISVANPFQWSAKNLGPADPN